MNEFFYILLLLLRISALVYLLLMCMYMLGWQKITKRGVERSVSYPMVSIVIAMRNEKNHIEALLDALHAQRYPIDRLEIILVDDGSDDGSASLALQKANALGMRHLKVISGATQGKKAALRIGLRQAIGEWILLTDADCIPQSTWVETMLETAMTRNAKMVLGPIKLEPLTKSLHQMQAAESNCLMAATAGSAGIGWPSMANGANMLLSSEVLKNERSGALQPRYASGDDMFRLEDVLRRYGSGSVTMAMRPEAVVITRPVNDLRAFFAQRMRWVSKSRGYRRPEVVVLALVVFVFNMLLATAFIVSPFFPVMWIAFLMFLMLKTLIDLPLVWPAFRLTGQTRLLGWFLVFQLVYPLYVMVVAIGGWCWPVYWKNRKISGQI